MKIDSGNNDVKSAAADKLELFDILLLDWPLSKRENDI